MDWSVQQTDNLEYFVGISNRDLIEEVTFELRCRHCEHAVEQHPMFYREEAGEPLYHTNLLDDADGAKAIPGQTTNFPCVFQRDAKGNRYITDWAVVVHIDWNGTSDCYAFTEDKSWSTLDEETGCQIWGSRTR